MPWGKYWESTKWKQIWCVGSCKRKGKLQINVGHFQETKHHQSSSISGIQNVYQLIVRFFSHITFWARPIQIGSRKEIFYFAITSAVFRLEYERNKAEKFAWNFNLSTSYRYANFVLLNYIVIHVLLEFLLQFIKNRNDVYFAS